VGAHVGVGATLARLSGSDLAAQVEQARAALLVQQAKLDGIKAGTRPEGVAVAQSAVSGAQSSVALAKSTVLQVARDAYVKSDDAVHNKVDQFLNNPRTLNPTFLFTLSNSQLQSKILTDRASMETLLNNWQTYNASLPADASTADIPSIQTNTSNYLSQVSAFLDETSSGLASAVSNSSYPTSAIQVYQSNVATARATVSGEVSALNTALTQEKSAESALATAQSQLTLTQAPATATDLEAQDAQVAAAQASLDYAQAQYGKTAIYAPISGTITVNNAKVGATASPGAVLISMNTDSQFEMDIFVSEADLSKVKVGDVVQVTLDAYQSDAPFAAHVTEVDPAATVANGVSAYKVTLQFDANDTRIQAGLTGSVKIITDTKTNALSVPTSAIITRGNSTFVMRETSAGEVLTPVTTGIESAGGMTQILSGVTAADRIRTFGNQ
jgi:RND family efflux transporter MFP subunit